jgi:hypothetical protein
MPSTMSLQGHVFNDAGTALQDVEVKVFKKNTTATALATDTSDANGRWDLSWSTSGDTGKTQVDVQGTSGTSVFRWKYDDRIAVSGAFIKDLHIIPESDFAFKFVGAPTANVAVTFPMATAGDAYTLAGLSVAQTFSAAQTHSADIIIQDASDLALGTGSDALLRWSTGDSSNHTAVIALGDSNQGLHVTDVGAVATDWNISATTHPNVYIHSNTTPATDYLRLGDHNGTTAYIDNVGGTTLAFAIAGTTEVNVTANGIEAENAAGPAFVNEAATTTNPTLVPDKAEMDTGIGWASDTLHFVLGGATHANLSTTVFTVSGDASVGDDLLLTSSGSVVNWASGDITLTHSAGTLTYGGDGAVVLAHGANVDLSFTGTTGTNDITLTDSLADALSITRGGTDMVVFNSAAPSITFTPATTFSGGIANAGTIAAGTWNGTAIASGYIADDAIDSEHYAAASIDFAHIQNVAANSILGRNANSSGVLSEVALATTQILIGDGTGFTAAALSGDATMTNAGVVSIGSGVIVNADINASAAIAISKTALTAGTNISLSTNTLNVDDAFLKNNASDATTGTVTMAHLIVGDDGNVGSASDGDAIAISSAGVVTFSQAVNIQGGYANGGGAPYDGVVDAGGGGNWTTIQAGDDALDDGPYTMLVKAGTYAENVVVSTNDVHIVVEPGTDIQGSVTLSGANIKLSLGPNCDLDGIIVSGDSCLVDGGGWSTISNGGTARIGISVTGSDVIVQNIAAQTTEDGGASYNAIDFVTGARGIVRNCKVITSDSVALNAEQAEMLVQGNYIATSDGTGIRVGAARNRIIGNFVNDAGSGEWSIDVNGNGDNSLIVGNITKDPGTTNYNINLRVNGDNCIMDGNRTDGTNTDSSTGSTVGDNETTTF